ncbi:ASKHA domain-containing protein [Halothermothrix orenii]|uniref:Ferredoxin n=1 Tax=Halothermothrix orenii (strain H 168 / OCM 544 / DSM 9562) TaxID=373903 RepID=B8CYB5_HALOH|nr:ASKHA domain-containing protein [Halothermothrix orenii]ACL70284.1 ferredoxin [Halothermothrix orenii H 168]
MLYKIIVRQNNKERVLTGKQGDNLLKILQKNHYKTKAPCGGVGTCGKCKVKVNYGGSQPTPGERELLDESEIKAGIRLACQTRISGHMEVELDTDEEIEGLVEGIRVAVEQDPFIQKDMVRLEGPSLDDQRDLLTRVSGAISSDGISLKALDYLASIDIDRELSVIRAGNRVIDINQDNGKGIYGIAVDIGTTTIAMYLIDLITGKESGVHSFSNPQKKFGADVISRINYTLHNDNGIKDLQQELVDGLNRGIKHLTDAVNLKRDEIYHLTIAGNTTMLHSLLGVDASSIARAPYIPVFTDSLMFRAGKLGFNINENGVVQLLPSISGYVGGDIVGDLLVTDFESPEWNLLIDIGTNGEIVLGNRDKLFACSAAAGPAFEGARITFGMAGITGAISKYRFNNGEVHYRTINNNRARGICGSGLVDIIAELLKYGFLKETGAFKDGVELKAGYADYLTTYKGITSFRVVPGNETHDNKDILLTQKDIREFQLAKGAILAGIKILLKEAGVDYSDIEKVYLAGGFGNYIDPHNASLIGLIPENLEDKVIRIGNGAGMGARAVLLDQKLIEYAARLKEKTTYIELSSHSGFQEEFMNSMGF